MLTPEQVNQARLKYNVGPKPTTQKSPAERVAELHELARRAEETKLKQQPEPNPSVGGFLGNVVKSGGEAIKNITSAVAHPVQTVTGLRDLVVGGMAKLVPGETPEGLKEYEGKADAVANFFKERYGSVENVKKTAYEDPVGFALDLSTVLGGGGAALKGAGTASKVSELTRAGEIVSRVGEVVDPLRAASKTVGAITGAAGKVIGETGSRITGLTTGAGTDVIKQAYQGGKEFTQALRGGTTGEDILNIAKEALDDLKTERRTGYRTNLQKVEDSLFTTKKGQLYVQRALTDAEAKGLKGYVPGSVIGVPTDLTLGGLKNVTTRTLKEFNIGAKGTELDFVKTPLPKSMQNDIQELVGRIYEWSDITPTGIDDLREVIASYKKGGVNMSSADKQYNAIVEKMRSNISSYIGERVPEIKNLNQTYAQQSSVIDELSKGLSLKEGVQQETQIKKLTSAMRENNEFRLQLIKKLEDKTGVNLEQAIAGLALSQGVPRGLIGKLFGGGVFGAGIATLNFPLVFGSLMSSPRLIGEVVMALGKGNKVLENVGSLIQKYGKPLKQLKRPAFQAGRVNEETK